MVKMKIDGQVSLRSKPFDSIGNSSETIRAMAPEKNDLINVFLQSKIDLILDEFK